MITAPLETKFDVSSDLPGSIEDLNDGGDSEDGSGSLPIRDASLIRLSNILGAVVVAGALLVLIGWAAGIEMLKRVVPGFVAMNPLTAICFVLGGTAILTWRQDSSGARTEWRRWVPGVCAWVVLIAGATVLLRILTGWDAGLDRILFSSKLSYEGAMFPNRMAPNTALGFVLIGGALLLLGSPAGTRSVVRECCAFLVGLVSLVALLGYAYRVDALYGMSAFIPMAAHTAVLFGLLAAAILWARPNEGMMKIVNSETPGGVVARRLLPSMILVVGGLGWLRLEGQRRGLYGDEIGVTLYTLAVIVIVCFLIGWIAWSLYRGDRNRAAMEAANRRLNRDLHLRATQLEGANQELESFSYSVSHDLRAPLRHVHGYVQMLKRATEGSLEEKPTRYLRIIEDASSEMGQLIDDLLSFSRMGRAEMTESEVDLNELVRQVIDGLEAATRDRNIEWTIAKLPRVAGDRALLRQAWVNLLENAVKYTRGRDPAVIEVGCEGRRGDRAILFVRDNGAGFDMEYADKLFGVFQRLHRADEFEGTGIGLANVRRIVSRHGGETWADGEVGRGAVFYLTLRLQKT